MLSLQEVISESINLVIRVVVVASLAERVVQMVVDGLTLSHSINYMENMGIWFRLATTVLMKHIRGLVPISQFQSTIIRLKVMAFPLCPPTGSALHIRAQIFMPRPKPENVAFCFVSRVLCDVAPHF
ncbi:hypothetical protein PVK06_019761 [Gossypium arboreum]|uniref:Uncharacterized protein n=1 Tax=Gossypium arboreum TaxID=29729 RepID=A0ABR0PKJ5_GOSAR|nr:hypothetical protein PVK06_019761 [Gossypium arboreum]